MRSSSQTLSSTVPSFGRTWLLPSTALWKAMPNVGVATAVANAHLLTSRPPVVEGRVYIGVFKYVAAGVPLPIYNFAKGGVYDSGWTNVGTIDEISAVFSAEHNLGAIPSSVEIWCRVDATTEAYPALVQRQVMTNLTITGIAALAGDREYGTILVPSCYHFCTSVSIAVWMKNSIADPAQPVALFTDSTGTDEITGQIRVIARR